QHAHVHMDGGLRLFEVGSIFARTPDNQTVEHTNLALLLDAPTKSKTASAAELQHAVRLMRGVIESAVDAMAGPSADLVIAPGQPHTVAFDPGAFAWV